MHSIDHCTLHVILSSGSLSFALDTVIVLILPEVTLDYFYSHDTLCVQIKLNVIYIYVIYIVFPVLFYMYM